MAAVGVPNAAVRGGGGGVPSERGGADVVPPEGVPVVSEASPSGLFEKDHTGPDKTFEQVRNARSSRSRC